MTGLRRRVFLSALVGGGLVAAGIGVAVLPLSPKLRLAHFIRSRLDYLQIADDVLDSFIRDYMADRTRWARHIGTMRFVAEREVYRPRIVRDRLPFFRFERHIVSQFLLSTDFFPEANVDRPLKYVAYNDPYRGGCTNPLATLG